MGGHLYPRRFALVRHIDYTGVSGVGVVAYGVVFFDGHVALRWCSDHPATSLWESIDDLVAVHGHGDGTSVQWIDDLADRLQDAAPSPRSSRGRRARRVTRHDEAAQADPWMATEPAGTAQEPDDPPAAAPPPPPPPADTPPEVEPPQAGQLPPWHSEVANGRQFSARNQPASQDDQATADETMVPSQRRSAGRHRKNPEPSEESAGHR